MVPVSEALKELLCRQGMSAGSAGTDDALEIDAGEPGKLNPAIGRREGGQTGPMGMGKRTPAEPAPVNRGKRQNSRTRLCGEPFLRLVADNVDVVPTRQGRGIARLSLVRT